METFLKNISKIRNISFTFEYFETIFKSVKKNWKNSYEFWEISEFIWNGKRMGYLIVY